MKLTPKAIFHGLTICSLICFATSIAQSSTIIKLNLGSVGPDVGMNAGQLSTINDGIVTTTGDQNTGVEFTGFLDPLPDINTSAASFTLNGLSAVGPTQQAGSLVIQNLSGGQFSLYDPTNVLLLQGPLSNSVLTGVIGPPGTGGLFTTTLSSVTGGTLASLIVPGSVSLSMNLTNVNGGAGLSVTGNVLNPFLADGSVSISGDPVATPEPSSIALLAIGAIGLIAAGRSCRSGERSGIATGS